MNFSVLVSTPRSFAAILRDHDAILVIDVHFRARPLGVGSGYQVTSPVLASILPIWPRVNSAIQRLFLRVGNDLIDRMASARHQLLERLMTRGRHSIYQVISDSQNNLWMAEFTRGHIGKINAKTSKVAWYPLPTPNGRARTRPSRDYSASRKS